MTGLRCPVCAAPLVQVGRVLRCPAAHSFDLAKEGYAYLLPLQKKHTAAPGDDKAMVQARRAFLQAGYYDAFRTALAALCLQYAPAAQPHIVDAGCGEGSYDQTVLAAFAAQGRAPALLGFDLSRDAVRLAAKLVPAAGFAVGGSFCAPVQDGWADVLLNIFSPFAGAEFLRMLRPGGVLLYAVPTARHLLGLKQLLYDTPYENEAKDTRYEGFGFVRAEEVTDTITVPAAHLQALFAMTPYYWKTPAAGAARLAQCESLTTEIGFRFLVYQKKSR